MVKTLSHGLNALPWRTVAVPAKTADDFYRSPQWRKCIAEIIRKRGRVCEDRDCDGRTHKRGMRVFGDHLTELRDGGAPYDERNIMLRCGASHTRKTAAARAKRMGQRFE